MATSLPAPREGNAPASTGAGGASPQLTLVATVLGTSMSFVVGSIINVALPAMQRGFGIGAEGAQLLINAYLLPVSALILLGGALGKHFGRTRFLSLGLTLLAAGSAACAVSPNIELLVASRVLQGVGAAMIAPNSLGLIADTFEADARRAAVSLWATVGAASGAVGPVVGGWIVDVADWRWAFAAIAPPVLAALILLHPAFAGRRPPATTPAKPVAAAGDPALQADDRPLDAVGGTLVTVLLAALVFLLVRFPRSGVDATSIGVAAIFVVATVAFLVVENRAGERAMVPLTIFGSAGFSSASVVTMLLYGGLGGLMVLLPYVLIGSLHYSATEAGAAILPIPAAMVGLSRPATAWLPVIGVKWALAIGSGLVAIGFGLLAWFAGPNMTYVGGVLPGMVVAGIGMAFSIGVLTPAIAGSVGPELAGVATNVNNATSRIGGLVATAMLGPVLTLSGGAGQLVRNYGLACWVAVGLAVGASLTAVIFFKTKGPTADPTTGGDDGAGQ